MTTFKSTGSALRVAVLATAIVAAAAAGCGRETPEEQATPDTTGTWITGEPREPIPDAAGGHTVIVSIARGDLAIPTEVAPGPTVFTITNAGEEPHDFMIQGAGIESRLENPIPAGGTEGLDVTLVAGTYEAWCPIEGHRELGERGQFTVVQ